MDSIPDIVERAKATIVKVQVPGGTGTGVIVDKRGLAITNRHVIGLESFAEVIDSRERVVSGQVVLSDADVDYAFLLTPPWDVEPLRFCEMASVREGETVVAIGHPLGLNFTVSKGIVSSKSRRYRNIDYIQTDTPINPGNSGGPLLNECGDIIGINTWIRSDGQNLGFAFPVDYVKRAMARLNIDFSAIAGGYYCNICGFLNFKFLESPKSRYCTNCGATVVFKNRPSLKAAVPATVLPADSATMADIVCPSCRKVQAGPLKYCTHCGSSLKKTSA